MKRISYFLFGIACHLMFLATYVWFALFIGNILVPKSIDSGPEVSLAIALPVNILLLVLFGLQHSIMARPAFKRVWTHMVPDPIERSVYVLSLIHI